MTTVEEALAIVSRHAWQAVPESVPLLESLNRKLAEAVSAKHPSPAFDNSGVDGFAVGSANRASWKVRGTVAAGDTNLYVIKSDEAMRIFTGARTPQGTEAILMQEDANLTGDELASTCNLRAQENLRRQGEEFSAGTIIVAKGSILDPGLVGEIAALGYSHVQVDSVPRVAILATGDELRPPGEALLPGQIFESNSIGLAAMLRFLGIDPTISRCNDSLDATTAAIKGLAETHDLLLTIGGVSVGERDFVKPAIDACGFEVQFSRVSIKPGKPVSFGTAKGGKAWFGLPGNPMSCSVAFLLFVLPFLGLDCQMKRFGVSRSFEVASKRDWFVPARLNLDRTTLIEPQARVGSHSLVGLADVDGLLRVPPGKLAQGEEAEFRFFPWRRLVC